ncbi:YfjI family protein [Parabacteroides merdae]|nr:YfjI family protein [Parabacteroides merdae]
MASACLPEVSGKYHRKRVFPHIFTVEVAPAANGKGCINDMRHPGRLVRRTDQDGNRTGRSRISASPGRMGAEEGGGTPKHRSVVVKDAPKPAAKAYLNIPTQVTKAKMLVHLRDNGNIGGLMADSEIDTILSASKQDYGMFDDLLRKAFHHEPVSSSRKTDNEMIRIDSPRLALLLSGTPGQFSRLIPDSESGLLSRLLLYTCRSEAVGRMSRPKATRWICRRSCRNSPNN